MIVVYVESKRVTIRTCSWVLLCIPHPWSPCTRVGILDQHHFFDDVSYHIDIRVEHIVGHPVDSVVDFGGSRGD